MVEVHPERFVAVTVPARLGPSVRLVTDRLRTPFFVLFQSEEIVIVALEGEWGREAHFLPGARAERGFRLITLETSPENSPRLPEILARLHPAGIHARPLSAFHRDHLLVREEEAAAATEIVAAAVEEYRAQNAT